MSEYNKQTIESRHFSGMTLQVRSLFWLSKPKEQWSKDEVYYYEKVLGNPSDVVALLGED